jgi:transcriptional regulator GlxA family with amidase domain
MSAFYLTLNDWNERAVAAQFNLDSLCVRSKISRRTLERLFRQKFQQSPSNWKNNLRLEKAADLLMKGFVAKEICVELDFTSVTNFGHQFRRRFGCSPVEYMRRQISRPELRSASVRPTQ